MLAVLSEDKLRRVLARLLEDPVDEAAEDVAVLARHTEHVGDDPHRDVYGRVQRGADRVVVAATVGAHLQVLEHRHAREDAATLGHLRDALAELNENARANLEAGRHHPLIGANIL